MTEVINARFHTGAKEYTFNPNGLQLQPEQVVVVSTTKGPALGVVTRGNFQIDEKELIAPLRPVLRVATQADLDEAARAEEEARAAARVRSAGDRERERKAFLLCKEKIAQHGLDMTLVSAQISADGGHILFNFTAEERVDFRALVKDLASTLHARIELRQIGARDETKLLGGIGICGRPFCCSEFLGKFQPVSIKMAKTQSLSLNPTKISGACGRLMCCLKYEQEAYEDAVRRCPKKESFVETPDGPGTVTDVNLLREKVKVLVDDSGEQPKSYYNQEIRVIRLGKGKRPEGYTPPPRAELEKLRYIPPKEERSGWEEPKSGLSEKLEEIFAADSQRTAKPPRSHSRARRSEPKSAEPARETRSAEPPKGESAKRTHSRSRRRRRPQEGKES